MRIPQKLSTTSQVTGEQLKTTVNQLIDVAKASQLTTDNKTLKLTKTPNGTSITKVPERKHTSSLAGGAGGGATPYNGYFKLIDVSETAESGEVTLKVLVCNGYTYIAPQPDADPPVAESYSVVAGYIYINHFYNVVASEKFTLTTSKMLVAYSEITEEAPYISDIVIEPIENVQDDLPDNKVFIMLGSVTVYPASGTLGGEDYKPASLAIDQAYETNNIIYLPVYGEVDDA